MAGAWSRAFAPACVGNVGVGFDILGHTVSGPCDHARVRRIAEPVVRIAGIEGLPMALPMEAARNTAGVALQSLLSALGLGHGFEVVLEKGIPLGSGMAGSAASCVAALVAANALLVEPLAPEALLPHALAGESLASGGPSGDNVGPMLLGGLVLAAQGRLVRWNVPDAWHCVLVHPDQVLETRAARAAVPAQCALGEAVVQAGNLALLLAGCERGDPALVRAGLRDVLVEPWRAPLVPGFAAVQSAALEAGAMGSSLSGAGPSLFAWFESRAKAEAAMAPMQAGFAAAGVDSRAFVSPIAGPAAALVSATA
jgi:homoserine kinase